MGRFAANVDLIGIVKKFKDLLRGVLSTSPVTTNPKPVIFQRHRFMMDNVTVLHNLQARCTKFEDEMYARAFGWGSCGVVHHEPGMTHEIERVIS